MSASKGFESASLVYNYFHCHVVAFLNHADWTHSVIAMPHFLSRKISCILTSVYI